jgi:hypothetical protein
MTAASLRQPAGRSALYHYSDSPKRRCYGIAQDFSAAFKFTGGVLWSTMPGGSGETGKVLVDPVDARIRNVKDK